ncbi:triadin-like isoform X2 [Silurus meridionalis]|uniref:triadin-like isoform X2 n=1 Tax=Silurus meridionalis TaxID=175797 RepID=UPI001EEA60D8|nr:triadin-like isoform X2 [Silurus meridionalis]
MEARTSTTTTTVLESKGGESHAAATRASKRTMMDDLYSTFSSPVAWVLVLALIITWSAVAIIVFDLVDSKTLEGPQAASARKAFKEAGSLRGGIQHMSREPVESVHKAMEESGDWMDGILTFMTNLVTPEEEEEEVEWQAVKKKGEFLPARKKVAALQAKEIIQKEEDVKKLKEEKAEKKKEEEDEKETSLVEEQEEKTEEDEDENKEEAEDEEDGEEKEEKVAEDEVEEEKEEKVAEKKKKKKAVEKKEKRRMKTMKSLIEVWIKVKARQK